MLRVWVHAPHLHAQIEREIILATSCNMICHLLTGIWLVQVLVIALPWDMRAVWCSHEGVTVKGA